MTMSGLRNGLVFDIERSPKTLYHVFRGLGAVG
jgi:hypothetical protein